MLPPSATLGVAVRLTVVLLMVSVTAVIAAAGLMASASKVAAGRCADRRRHAAGVDVHVVAGCRDGHRAGGGAGGDGDGRAVAQRDADRGLRRRCSSVGGVDDVAAFGHAARWQSGSPWWCPVVSVTAVVAAAEVDRQRLEVAAAGVADRGRRRCRHRRTRLRPARAHADRSRARAGRDRDDGAVGQRHRHRRLRDAGQRRRVDDVAALGHAAGGAQAHGCRVDRVGDRGRRGCRADRQRFEVAAAGTD